MVTFFIAIVVGLITYDTCAMEKQKGRPRVGSLTLSLPSVYVNKSFTSSESPKRSPNGSASISPSDSPRTFSEPRVLRSSSKEIKDIKISPKKSPKGRESYCQEQFEIDIWEATEKNDTEAVRIILQRSMNFSRSNEGKTPLIKAIKNSNAEIVKMFLAERNINVNLADKFGNTPLHHALLTCNGAADKLGKAIEHEDAQQWNIAVKASITIIELLIKDYRLNPLIPGNGNMLAEKLLDHSFYKDKNEFTDAFRARVILETVIKEQVASINNIQEKDTLIFDSVIATIKTIYKLPSYATDDFLRTMLQYRQNTK